MIGGTREWGMFHSVVKSCSKYFLISAHRIIREIAPRGVREEIKDPVLLDFYDAITQAADEGWGDHPDAGCFAKGATAREHIDQARDILVYGMSVDEPYKKLIFKANEIFVEKLKKRGVNI